MRDRRSKVARIRTIKPDFWTDDKLTECSLSARLLFIGTWNFADDAGNLDRSAKQIKARVFPVDNIDCEPLLIELITQGLLIEYSVDGKKYLHIQGFTKHQVINRPSKPACPAFDESRVTHGGLSESSVGDHNGREGKGREVKNTSPSDKSDDGFLEFWSVYPKKKKKGDALKAWAKLKDKRNTLTLILGALTWQSKTLDWTKEGGQFIPYPATYLNSQSWLDEPAGKAAPAVPFDRAAYEAKRKDELAAARERYRREQEAGTVPVQRSAP